MNLQPLGYIDAHSWINFWVSCYIDDYNCMKLQISGETDAQICYTDGYYCVKLQISDETDAQISCYIDDYNYLYEATNIRWDWCTNIMLYWWLYLYEATNIRWDWSTKLC